LFAQLQLEHQLLDQLLQVRDRQLLLLELAQQLVKPQSMVLELVQQLLALELVLEMPLCEKEMVSELALE
jgi:hypothetical protein